MLLIGFIIAMALFAFLGYKKPGFALITSPIAAILLALVSTFVERTEGILTAPLVLIASLIAILMSERDPDSDQIPQRCAKWTLIFLFLLIFFLSGFALFGKLGSLGLMFVVLFIGFVMSYAFTSRRAIAAYILSTIGSSMRQNLPLAMALDSAAAGQTDTRSRILRRIKKWLVQGYSLSEAIKRGYPKCPGFAVGIITAAEKIDQLPLAFKAIEADMVAKTDERSRIRPIHPLYPVILVIFMFLLIMALTTFVFPQFTSILYEMSEGGQLPKTTQIMIETTNIIAYGYGWLVGLIMFLIFSILVPVSIYIKFRPRRPDKPYIISRFGDFIKWHLPVLHWFENNYSMTQVVELLGLSLNSGSTVNDAIANTLNLDINTCFKKRLLKWLKKVEAGENISVAAKQSKLGNPLAWAFDQQTNQGNTLAVLEALESFYRSNYSYRVNLARFIMCPCITILVGAMVGFVVYAIFSPMVAIINNLASMP
jgi:type IV pilus assembly protein PilC